MSAIMKTLFVTLLALPAILAAPAPAPVEPGSFIGNDFKCRCINDVGDHTAAGCYNFGAVPDRDTHYLSNRSYSH
ncbi:hypothetical protein VTL71DRAFT_4102 [Oculimacula yallundae]|uniref:Uncharacterized protein n=1 Tax=Oculimacula yallundae TaxID=86028 RepID=A0ABR4C5M3_9HELO